MSSNPAPPPTDLAESPVSPDELLPPVEPPNAGFILQLFIIPALIVLAVFLLVLAIGWMRESKEDPIAKVAALRKGNQARWQQAFELAQMMIKPEGQTSSLKQDSALASEVAKLLDEEVDFAGTDDNSVNLRYYLCRILGEFHVDDGLGVLLRTARKDQQLDVRRQAINATAVLGDVFNSKQPPRTLSHPELVDTFVQLANHQDDLLRSQAAYAIGVFVMQPDVDDRLVAELEKLADDLYPDARYNAAIALARLGNLHAVDAVSEMLDPAALASSISSEQIPTLQPFKRDTILHNALNAAQSLLDQNPHIDLPELTAAVQEFVSTAPEWQEPAPVPEALIRQAENLLATASEKP